MSGVRWVSLATVRDGFHARLLVARLGAEGILTQVRGGLDGPYPTGAVEVLVAQDDLAEAREVLLADEVEDALAGADEPDDGPEGPSWRDKLLVAAAVVALAAFAVARAAGGT